MKIRDFLIACVQNDKGFSMILRIDKIFSDLKKEIFGKDFFRIFDMRCQSEFPILISMNFENWTKKEKFLFLKIGFKKFFGNFEFFRKILKLNLSK